MINDFIEERRTVTLITPLRNFRTWGISSSYERAAGKVFTAISVQLGFCWLFCPCQGEFALEISGPFSILQACGLLCLQPQRDSVHFSGCPLVFSMPELATVAPAGSALPCRPMYASMGIPSKQSNLRVT